MDMLISELPVDLSHQEAVEGAYGADLNWITERLCGGLSVLVECDKQLTHYVYRALRDRLKARAPARALRLISGLPQAADAEGPPMDRMRRLVTQLQRAVFEEAGPDRVLALPQLDVLTTTTRSGLSGEAREVAALLFENPAMVFLGFKDPSFELPKVIEGAFPARRALMGIGRERLPQLILQREARKFGVTHFNPYRLYKYLSGLNAVRCREVLSDLHSRTDFDPAAPARAAALYRALREMTLVADFELPNVDLDADIGGYAGVKEQLRRELLSFLARRDDDAADGEEVRQIEELIPKGLIFHGPPGTGKTFFCKAIATALDATILIVSGPELKSKWVGESEENLRKVFAQARRAAPSIIVFDELDSFASARGTYTGSGVEHSMVNQLLTEMDGFRGEELVFVVGTTNFLESLDPALLRPGRFELNIHIPYPEEVDRREVLDLYNKKFALPLSGAQLDWLARKTEGVADPVSGARYSGDHLYALMRGLKRQQVRAGAGWVATEEALREALGDRRRPRPALLAEERRVVAAHEAGHALCAYLLPNAPKVEEVRVGVDSAEALGCMVQERPERRYVTSRGDLLDQICVLLGGRVAEELVVGDVSMGAYDDLRRATALARLMVESLGMSAEAAGLGLRTFDAGEGALPAAWAARVEEEVSRLVEEQRARAEGLLSSHRGALERLAARLVAQGSCDLSGLQEAVIGAGG